ncbi:MAG: MBL fold metallo-hydrolase [Candidatus Eiseniibacteriota bacterium]
MVRTLRTLALLAILLLSGSVLSTHPALAQTSYMPGAGPNPSAPSDSVVRVVVHPLAPGVYAAKVRYVWTGWVELPDGILLIDSSLDDSTAAMLADSIRVRSGAKPIKYLVNTHAHLDHIGGNNYFASRGATIIAQASVAARIDSTMRARAGSTVNVKEFKPVMKVDRKKILGPADRRVEILWFGRPAHSAADLIVYLPKQKVLFAGDIVTNKSVPWMLDPAMNRKNWIAAVDSIMGKGFTADSIVPGHGILAPKVDEYRFIHGYLTDAYNRAAKIASMGTSLNAFKDWGYVGPYEDAEFYNEVHFMNMRRLYNEALGIKTPGRAQPGAFKK